MNLESISMDENPLFRGDVTPTLKLGEGNGFKKAENEDFIVFWHYILVDRALYFVQLDDMGP